MRDNETNNHDKLHYQYAAIAQHFDNAARGSSSLDVDVYLKYLDDIDMPDNEKRALIKALAAVVVGFVDLGFGTHPLQQTCGKQVKSIDDAVETDSNEIKPT